ncbi:MAG TPA: cupin domain-containing protein [Chloroflexota bacterium]|nr:cupin domain-containing protein [Chloroflexota bacterium]
METTDRRETTEAAAIAVPPDGGAAVWLLGDTYTLKIAGEQTGGAFGLLEARVPPHSGPPPHRHLREDETFVVLEGALEFRANGRTVSAPAGTVIHVPRGTVHSYATVGTTPVRILFLVRPGRHGADVRRNRHSGAAGYPRAPTHLRGRGQAAVRGREVPVRGRGAGMTISPSVVLTGTAPHRHGPACAERQSPPQPLALSRKLSTAAASK